MPLPLYFSSLVTYFCAIIDRVSTVPRRESTQSAQYRVRGISCDTRGRRQHAEGSRLARSRNRNPHRKQWRSCKTNARNKSTFHGTTDMSAWVVMFDMSVTKAREVCRC